MGKRLGLIWEAQVGPIWGKSGTQLDPIWAIPFETQMGTIWVDHVGPIWVQLGAQLGLIWAFSFGTQTSPIWGVHVAPYGVNMGRTLARHGYPIYDPVQISNLATILTLLLARRTNM